MSKKWPLTPVGDSQKTHKQVNIQAHIACMRIAVRPRRELGTREGLSGEITLVLRPNTEQVVRSLGAGIPGVEKASAKALREDQACHGHKEADVAGE